MFDAKRPHAKYHSEGCRKAAQRHPGQVGKATAKRKPGGRRRTRLQAATLRELEAEGKAGTTAGLLALELAERIDAGAETVAALAAAARAHAEAMDRALRDGPDSDPVQARRDEVTARRQRHLSEAGG